MTKEKKETLIMETGVPATQIAGTQIKQCVYSVSQIKMILNGILQMSTFYESSMLHHWWLYQYTSQVA